LNLELQAIYHPLYLILAGIGLWESARSGWKPGEVFLLVLVVAHYGVSFLVLFNLTEWQAGGIPGMVYFSGRHLMPLLVVSIYWIGKGFLSLHEWLASSFRRPSFAADSGTVAGATRWILFILMAFMILPKTLKTQRYDRVTEKWAGVWIEGQTGRDKVVFTTLPRVAYYAGGELILLQSPGGAKEKLAARPLNPDAVYLAFEAREVLRPQGEVGSWDRDFTEVKRFSGKGMETVVVYRKAR
jgi:hypothetical protein